MNRFFRSTLPLILPIAICSCNTQVRTDTASPTDSIRPAASGAIVGGGCDGCELMYAGMPSVLDHVDTSAGWQEAGEKLLVHGTIYKLDGTTPAPDVILYYYHTNSHGYYAPRTGMDQRAERHGYLRGWVKSDANGHYAIYTIRPAPYPNERAPAHIHIFVRQPDIATEYYIDELVFDDDSLVTDWMKDRYEKRGGSGVLKISRTGDMQVARHDVVLGLNVPGYPGG